MKYEDPLGLHGVVVLSESLEEDARRWQRLSGLPVLRRGLREIVLGYGPELFVVLRRAPRGRRAGVSELHLAVRGLRAADAAPDALGGRSAERELSGLRLVVREFEGPPRGRWKQKRSTAATERPPRRAGTARSRSSRRGSK